MGHIHISVTQKLSNLIFSRRCFLFSHFDSALSTRPSCLLLIAIFLLFVSRGLNACAFLTVFVVCCTRCDFVSSQAQHFNTLTLHCFSSMQCRVCFRSCYQVVTTTHAFLYHFCITSVPLLYHSCTTIASKTIGTKSGRAGH